MSESKELEAVDFVEQGCIDKTATIREKLMALEAQMRQHPNADIGGKVTMPARHYFTDGLYAREITIPRGTLLTGKIHKTEHLNIISQGDISVLTEDGPKRLQAPCTLISKPGMKRAGYAHDTTVWTTIHANPTNETDVTKLEAQLVTDDYLEVEGTPCPSLL